MKKVFYTLLITTAFVNTNKAQNFVDVSAGYHPEASNTALNGLGIMTFEKETHDFDTIEYAGNGTYDFKFKNTGKEPIIITEAKGSCGCTIPTYPKDIPVKSGESQLIKVTYDTKRTGFFTKTVTVKSNAKDPVKVLTIKGFVRAKPVEQTFSVGVKPTNGFVPFEK